MPRAKTGSMSLEARREMERQNREAFIDEYRHFKGYGYSPQQIAERLGMNLKALQEKVRKLKLEKIYTSEEKYFLAELERRIESGEPFSTNNLPNVLDDYHMKHIITNTKASGRIRAVGKAKSAGSTSTTTLWVGVKNELEESDAA